MLIEKKKIGHYVGYIVGTALYTVWLVWLFFLWYEIAKDGIPGHWVGFGILLLTVISNLLGRFKNLYELIEKRLTIGRDVNLRLTESLSLFVFLAKYNNKNLLNEKLSFGLKDKELGNYNIEITVREKTEETEDAN
jgi:hypothetical protein